MSGSANHLSIYLIVFLNAACHCMLIWRVKVNRVARLKFCALAFALPAAIMATMRLMVGLGLVHARLAEQAGLERMLTALASMLLLLTPFLATGLALWSAKRQRSLVAL